MKRYVIAFVFKPGYREADRLGKHPPGVETHDIIYDVEPHWTFTSKEHAETESRILQSMRIHDGGHYCQLEVEQVGDEKYAIVCNDHPLTIAH